MVCVVRHPHRPIDTGAFIIRHPAEVAKTANKNVISIGDTITAIVIDLGYGDRLSHLKPYFFGCHFDVGTLHHMHIINTRDDTIWYLHHKQILLTLPNIGRTIVTNRRNWNCNRVTINNCVTP